MPGDSVDWEQAVVWCRLILSLRTVEQKNYNCWRVLLADLLTLTGISEGEAALYSSYSLKAMILSWAAKSSTFAGFYCFFSVLRLCGSCQVVVHCCADERIFQMHILRPSLGVESGVQTINFVGFYGFAFYTSQLGSKGKIDLTDLSLEVWMRSVAETTAYETKVQNRRLCLNKRHLWHQVRRRLTILEPLEKWLCLSSLEKQFEKLMDRTRKRFDLLCWFLFCGCFVNRFASLGHAGPFYSDFYCFRNSKDQA